MQGGRKNDDISLFGDPFRFKRGGNVFSTFFDRDPFDDPFFTRSFGSAFGSSSIFGPEGFFGNPYGFTDDQEYQVPQSSRRGPVIEELPDDHEDGHNKSSQEPIVEDPDDNQGHKTQTERGNRSVYGQGTSNFYPRQSSSQTYTFQSSKVTYGGQNGAYYTSSTTRRMGPEGVTQEEHMEADTTTGNATKRISRGIKDKGHSITEKRNSDGRVETKEILHNMDEDEIEQFENEWNKKADSAQPGWKDSHAQMLDNGTSGRNFILYSEQPGWKNSHAQMLDNGTSGKRNALNRTALPGPLSTTTEQEKKSHSASCVPLSNTKEEDQQSQRNNKEDKQSHRDNSFQRWFGLRKG